MFSILPDLTPHDSHSLWYTSSRSPIPPASFDPANQHGSLLVEGGDGAQRHQHRRQHGGASQAVLERTALARLRADEAYQDRRRHNVGNFGATWLKPPGIAKSLFQLREERREQEEHAEAVRREQLAQQLAEAEEGAAAAATAAAVAAAAAEEGGGGGGMVGENGQMMVGPGGEDEMMGDGDEETQPQERDLDDEIPDADEEGFGYDGADSDEESDSDRTETTDDDDTEDGRGGNGGGGGPAAELRQVVAAEDRVLGMMSRGQGRRQDVDDLLYAGEEEVDDEDRAEMLQEDDLAHHSRGYGHGLLDDDDGLDMDMDGDLDDEIPEAESGMYEHTDTEASLMTSDDEHEHADRSFAVGQHPASAHFMGASSARASHRSGNPRHSIDISSILSRDGSSMAGSSPNVMRRH